MRTHVLGWLSFDNLWNVCVLFGCWRRLSTDELRSSAGALSMNMIFFGKDVFLVSSIEISSDLVLHVLHIDPVLEWWNWSEFSAKWLEKVNLLESKRRKPSTTTIYHFFTNNQNTPINGGGSYTLDELFHVAGEWLRCVFSWFHTAKIVSGLPPWLPARILFSSPEMWARLTESFHRFTRERWFKSKRVSYFCFRN